jgi:photosystem II stability/assembly factor-like uncharacterized protein
VALIVVAILVAPFTLAPANAQAACGSKSGFWTSVAGPNFPIGGAAMTDHAVDARDPGTVYATNGKAVMKSSNFGCTWTPAYVLGEGDAQPFTPETATIRAIVTSEAVTGHVHLAIDENVVAVTRPHTVSSTNAGNSWLVGDAGLPPAGSVEFMTFAPRAARVGYLGIDLGSGSIDSLYATSDGGLTWQARTQNIGGGYTGLVVDPLLANELWAWGPSGLHHSTDGGANFTPIDDFVGAAAGPVDVFHAPGSPARVMAFVPEGRFMLRSDDGGQTWLENYSPGTPDSVVHGSISESVLVSSAGDVYGYAASLFNWINMEAPSPGVVDLAVDRAASPSFYGRTARTIEIFHGPQGADITLPEHGFEIPPIYTPDPGSLPEPLTPDPKLNPAKSKVKIAAGETRKQRYSLAMSKVFTPLDVYLLVDTSESAKRFLRGLAMTLGDVINELVAARIDVQIGIGEYRNYPDGSAREPYRPPCEEGQTSVPGLSCENNFVYRQVLDVQPVSQALGDALSNLEAIAGGHYNAAAPALIQAATGSGVDLFPPGPQLSHDVPKGQGATFRDGSFRVILNATDEAFPMSPYDNDDRPPDQPSIQDAIDALNNPLKRIKQIGLALGPGSLRDLQEVARGTDALASDQGVDCDGDGLADLTPGSPLVCMVEQNELEQGSNLVPAIVNMVEAVRDREPIHLTAEGREGVVAKIAPETYPAVVQQRSNVLDFTVTYRCPLAMAGERTDIDLAARNGEGVLAKARTTVVCGPREEEDFLSLFNFDQVLAVIPLIPSAPPSVTELSSSTQVQSQAQAQGAMATQEQEQPQVAFAHQYKAELRQALSRDDDYAMTAYQERTRGEAPARLMFAAAAVLMSLTYAYAASTRNRLRYRFNRR